MMSYKRRTKRGPNGTRKTTTINTRGPNTYSNSIGKKDGSQRTTYSTKNGRVKVTETFRDGAGFIRRKTKTYGGPPKPVAKSRSSKRSNNKPLFINKWVWLGIALIIGYTYLFGT